MRCALPALVALLLAGGASADAPRGYRTVVVFGDTQALVAAGPEDPSPGFLRFLAMTRWVAERRDAENIDFVLHVGDVTQHGQRCHTSCDEADARRVNAEWDRFLEGWSQIEAAGIPYAIVPGNHDNVYPLLLPEPGRTTPVDAFATHFGRERFEGGPFHVATCDADTPDPRCGGFFTLGHVWRFRLGGEPVLVAGLPDRPNGGAMAWFEDALRASPDTPAVLLSHQWLRPADLLWFRFLASGRGGGPGPLTEQVFLTAMGHVTADRQQLVSEAGLEILSVQFDRQGIQGPGDAAILLLRFGLGPPGLDRVDALRLEPRDPAPRDADDDRPPPRRVREGFAGPVPFSIDRDLDSDGVGDGLDVCPEAFDPAQRDADGDGRGDRCDADLDDDGAVDVADLRVLVACWRAQRRGGALPMDLRCAGADMDGSGRLGRGDLRLLLAACGDACRLRDGSRRRVR